MLKKAPLNEPKQKFALHAIISINKLYFWDRDRAPIPCQPEVQNFIATALPG